MNRAPCKWAGPALRCAKPSRRGYTGVRRTNMVFGYHVVFSAYGFWLPNDPRGSWSDFVGSWELFRQGPATKTTETRSLAHIEHDRAQRLAAKKTLKYPPVEFTGVQARAVGR